MHGNLSTRAHALAIAQAHLRTDAVARADRQREALAQRFGRVRAASEALAARLSDEDCAAQSMPDASPVKWHLAHTTWFFETFVLEAHEPGFRPFDPSFRMLFNSYYETVGDRPPRPERGLLTRPSRATVMAWRAQVDARVRALLARPEPPLPPRALELVELGLQHEQQHQELIVTDLKHLLSRNPLAPAWLEPAGAGGPTRMAGPSVEGAAAVVPPAGAPRWLAFEPGIVEIGSTGEGFAFDNESPRHRQFLEAHLLADRLSTNAEYLAFVEAGGYRDPRWWLSEGWDWARREQAAHPLYWRRDGARWLQFTAAGLAPLAPDEPVAHLSFFEADAFARFCGARLPTEAEWERAVAACGASAPDALARAEGFADEGRFHPRPAAAADGGLRQAFGALWQWTASSYAPYPGFAPAAGAVGEYNGKFMVNQYVLRGASCATPRDHARASYRNFFPTHARWQFSGVRLARDA